MVRLLGVLAVSLLVVGCEAEDGDDECSCEARPALETPYDNMSSMLGAANVQDALDELAGRPVAEASVGSRLVIVEKETPNTGGEIMSANASCPDVEHDLALGGACWTQPLPGVALAGSDLGEAGYSCTWHQPMDNVEVVKVSVRCLRNAR